MFIFDFITIDTFSLMLVKKKKQQQKTTVVRKI